MNNSLLSHNRDNRSGSIICLGGTKRAITLASGLPLHSQISSFSYSFFFFVLFKTATPATWVGGLGAGELTFFLVNTSSR